MKKLFKTFIICLVLLLSFHLVSCKKKETEEVKSNDPVAVVQMDVNPSISFVIDENKVVLSVYGENDEGKMIISNENIVGLSLDAAIEKIIELETKTGYLVKEAENQIKYVIESDKQELLNELETKVKEKTALVCEKYNITEKVTLVKEAAYDKLVERAMQIDPSLTEASARKMSSKELVKYIMGSQLEKATIPTEELVNFYNKIKENRISFVEKEETKKVVDTLETKYQEFKDNYAEMLTSLKEASEKINNLYYEHFVSTESDYYKCLENIKNAKMELLKLKDELAQIPEDSVKHSLKKAEIIAKEKSIEVFEKALETAKVVAEELVNKATDALDKVISKMENSINELPADIKNKLNESLTNVEAKVNEAKDSAFKYFEENYKDDINAAMTKVSEYKASLVEQLKK